MRLFLILLIMAASALALEQAQSTNQGAKIDPETGTVAAAPPPLESTPTFIEAHSARVANDLVLFPPMLMGMTPPSRERHEELFASVPPKAELHFFTAAETVLSEHAPRPFRILFFGAVHLGPAIFDGGGMGARIAGRGL